MPKARKIRYAIVGVGDIARSAFIPSFRDAPNSELTALVSGDRKKSAALARKLGVERVYDYEHFDDCLRSGDIDAVYVSTPNSLHGRFAIPAALAGIHVLCEKPLATSVRECLDIADAVRIGGAKLMTAYRLHFEPANREAFRAVEAGRIGDPVFFASVFGFTVEKPNIRLEAALGGGPLFDIGIYSINAARTLLDAEPDEVLAWATGTGRPQFDEVPETVSALLRFPGGRHATFTCSFGSSHVDAFRLVGTKGDIRMEDAFEWGTGKTLAITAGDRTRTRTFAKIDQFAAELKYFSRCILENREPAPNVQEGLADVRVVEALHRSLRNGRVVRLREFALAAA